MSVPFVFPRDKPLQRYLAEACTPLAMENTCTLYVYGEATEDEWSPKQHNVWLGASISTYVTCSFAEKK